MDQDFLYAPLSLLKQELDPSWHSGLSLADTTFKEIITRMDSMLELCVPGNCALTITLGRYQSSICLRGVVMHFPHHILPYYVRTRTRTF